MNILHLTTYLQGGAGQVVVDLAEATKTEGGTAEVVASNTEYPGYHNYLGHLERLKCLNIPLTLCDSLFKRDRALNEEVVDVLVQKIEKTQYDIIHAHSAIPAKIALNAIERSGISIPVMQTMQGWGNNKTKKQEEEDVGIMNRLCKVVAVSQSSKSLLVPKGVDARRIEVIYNGVSELSDEFPGGMDLPDFGSRDCFTVGCVGTVCKRKNQTALIEAVALLRKEGLPVNLALIGDDAEDSGISEWVQKQELGEFIVQLGYQKEARKYLKKFDLFCLPTLAEGSPLSIMECMGDRVPISASNISEIKELIEHKVSGLLFDPLNPDAIANSIREWMNLSDIQTERMLDAAQEKFLLSFTKTRQNERYQQLYLRLLKGGK